MNSAHDDLLEHLQSTDTAAARKILGSLTDEALIRLSEGYWEEWEREGPLAGRPAGSRRRYATALQELVDEEVDRRIEAARSPRDMWRRLREPYSWQKWVEHRARSNELANRVAAREMEAMLGTSTEKNPKLRRNPFAHPSYARLPVPVR